ncbi:MAG: hypothetical protein TR69_WS6001001311 [candidate division WS6 bacterium OLB20]|uniref:Collagen triple helix repeat (20 copies) n=1 Tax=candidate division WS6 bacterium OLB20 TaxID=1617426 RepID=A0A136LWK1_9BACT|nr:MAG: hypothetical protein TR69_WS6001001311 [candidate division WS6 bacterium OLB20]
MKRKLLRWTIVTTVLIVIGLFLAAALIMSLQTRDHVRFLEQRIAELENDSWNAIVPEDEPDPEAVLPDDTPAEAGDKLVADVSKYLFTNYANELQGEQGVKGDKGDTGETGPSAISPEVYYNSDSGSGKISVTAVCPAERPRPLGGGCRGNNTDPSRVMITQSYPTGNLWNCAARHLDNASFELQVAVICST